ncbi:MAG TPA: hypothetical protein VNC50_18900 [Planctomycetia bacterium]|nr:hypothetical protein [Planctomycetia bacterium]
MRCFERARRRTGAASLELLLIMLMMVVMGTLLPSVTDLVLDGFNMERSNNLKQLGIALHNYSDGARDAGVDAWWIAVESYQLGSVDADRIRGAYAQFESRQGELESLHADLEALDPSDLTRKERDLVKKTKADIHKTIDAIEMVRQLLRAILPFGG